MKKILLVIAIVLAVLQPATAEAMPVRWRNSPVVTQQGVTYRVDRGVAVVIKTKGKNVTIPFAIRYKGKRYVVRAIWDGALKKNKALRKVNLRAYLETCEDFTLFKRDARKVRITVYRASDYKWLTRKGNTSLVRKAY